MLMPRTTWAEATSGLAALGFRKRRGGAFAAHGVTLTEVDGWATLSTGAAAADADPGGAWLGRPGLWKPASNGDGPPTIVFDVPLRPVIDGLDAADDDAGDALDAMAAIARWAVHTRPGADAPPWQPPPPERLNAILPGEARSLRSGPYLQPARLEADDGRLALRTSICRVGDPMPPARGQWLNRLLADCRGLRMVRVGIRETADGPALEAEADLTGAPAGVLESTLPVALDALQACFGLIAATATFICDPQRRSLALERDPAELLTRTTTKSSRTSKTRRTRA
jgi:hypothetical protein